MSTSVLPGDYRPNGGASLADKQIRWAHALERLARAVGDGEPPEQLAAELLQPFIEVGAVEAAVLRLREDDVLTPKACVGLDAFPVATMSVERVLAEFRADKPSANRAAWVMCEPPADWRVKRERGSQALRTLHRLGLWNGQELLGTVELGSVEEMLLPPEDGVLLQALASLAVSILVRRRVHRSLEMAVQSRDEVLAVVAHDLRNPLNVVSVAANSLLKRIGDSAMRRPLDRIVRAARRADRLIGDLMAINAIEGGRLSIDARETEIADVILAALESQHALAASASIILASDLSPSLPKVRADEERLLEVLENLLGNALKFTDRGGFVTVGASARERDVLVWVKDNGPGIASEQLPQLFDRFWQAKQSDRRGTGLGLTICKGIVEAHGGRIWVESALRQGTTVYFTMPADGGAAIEREPGSVVNILMVDDRPENLLSLTAILDQPGYHLVAARSGEEALSVALRTPFTVALIDIAMPIMSGLDVAVHLKQLERSRDIPIIFITAFGDDPEEIHRAYAAGGADYLVKPL
ncbi:MAG TPA: hybrid sensor histidine kinase/response regulator, partial [Polyangiaceae bacterium]